MNSVKYEGFFFAFLPPTSGSKLLWFSKYVVHSEPILDFWGPYTKQFRPGGGGGGGGLSSSGYERMNETHVSLHFESRSWKASLCFQLVIFVSSKKLYDFHVTWFDWLLHRKGDSTALQWIIIHVFKAAGQIQSTKLKRKHLWEQGGPLVFRGPYAACVFCE